MNEFQRTELRDYLRQQTGQCKAREQALSADDRGDEAMFARVQGNVFDIFSTILSVAEKTCGGDDEKLKAFFLTKLETIPRNWRESLDLAAAHGDTEKACLEELKLAVVAEIRGKLGEVTA